MGLEEQEHRTVDEAWRDAARKHNQQRHEHRDESRRRDDDRAQPKPPHEPAYEERAENAAGAEEDEHRADQRGRRTALAREDEHDQVERVEDEVGSHRHQPRRPDEGLAPEPGQAGAHLRDEPFSRRGIAAEVPADEEQRDHRDEIRDRVEQERHEPAEAEEQPTEGRSAEGGGVVAALVAGQRGLQVVVRDDARQRRALADAEEDETAPLDERDEHDLGERDSAEGESDDDAGQGQSPGSVGKDHHALPVPTVDQRSGGRRQEQKRQCARRIDDPRLGGRACRGEHEQRKRDPGDAAAEVGQRLTQPEQVEVAVPPERAVSRHAGKSSAATRTGAEAPGRASRSLVRSRYGANSSSTAVESSSSSTGVR